MGRQTVYRLQLRRTENKISALLISTKLKMLECSPDLVKMLIFIRERKRRNWEVGDKVYGARTHGSNSVLLLTGSRLLEKLLNCLFS